MDDLAIAALGSGELRIAEAFYRSLSTSISLHPDETVLLARHTGNIIAAVRLAPEHGVLVLRTMRVHPDWQQRGIGTALLLRLAPVLGSRECFCLPWKHLQGFYGQAGFETVKAAGLPPFLRERLRQYQADGHRLVAMRRSSLAAGRPR